MHRLAWCGLVWLGRGVLVCKTALLIFFSFYLVINLECDQRKVQISLGQILGTPVFILHPISELFASRQGSALYLCVVS